MNSSGYANFQAFEIFTIIAPILKLFKLSPFASGKVAVDERKFETSTLQSTLLDTRVTSSTFLVQDRLIKVDAQIGVFLDARSFLTLKNLPDVALGRSSSSNSFNFFRGVEFELRSSNCAV